MCAHLCVGVCGGVAVGAFVFVCTCGLGMQRSDFFSSDTDAGPCVSVATRYRSDIIADLKIPCHAFYGCLYI